MANKRLLTVLHTTDNLPSFHNTLGRIRNNERYYGTNELIFSRSIRGLTIKFANLILEGSFIMNLYQLDK